MNLEQYVNHVKGKKQLQLGPHLTAIENSLVTAYANVQNCFDEQLDSQEYSVLNEIFIDVESDFAERTILKFNLSNEHTIKLIGAIKSYMLTFYDCLKNDKRIGNKYSFTFDSIAQCYSFCHHGKQTCLTLNDSCPHMTIQLEPTEHRQKNYTLRIDIDKNNMGMDNLGQWIIDSKVIEIILTVE